MKRLDELGVSPAPWALKQTKPEGRLKFADLIMDSTGNCVATILPYDDHPSPSTRMMATAPELYEALREAVIEACHACDACGKHGYRKCRKADGECFVQRWRKVLAKAGGAE